MYHNYDDIYIKHVARCTTQCCTYVQEKTACCNINATCPTMRDKNRDRYHRPWAIRAFRAQLLSISFTCGTVLFRFQRPFRRLFRASDGRSFVP